MGAEAPGAGWHHGVSPARSPARSAAAGTARTGAAPTRWPRPRRPACRPGTRAEVAEVLTPMPMLRDAVELAIAVLSKPTVPTKRPQGLHIKDKQPAKTAGIEPRVSLSLRVSSYYCVDLDQTAAMVIAGNAAQRALTPWFP